jgi:hypothetical protein
VNYTYSGSEKCKVSKKKINGGRDARSAYLEGRDNKEKKKAVWNVKRGHS